MVCGYCVSGTAEVDMKKIHIILLIVFAAICLLIINNFSFGPKGLFYKTLDDCPNTMWVDTDSKFLIEVFYEKTDEPYESKIVLSTLSSSPKEKFNVYVRYDKLYLFKLDENDNEITNVINDENGNVICGRAKYRKNILGNITSFKIILDGNQAIAGCKTLKFKKKI